MIPFFFSVVFLFSPMILFFSLMVPPSFFVVFLLSLVVPSLSFLVPCLFLVSFSSLVSYILMALFFPTPYIPLTPYFSITFPPWQLLRTTLFLPKDNFV